MIQKLKTRWQAETPILSRLLQGVCGILVFIPHYYATLPEEFKVFSPVELKIIAVVAIIAAVLLNLTKRKTK